MDKKQAQSTAIASNSLVQKSKSIYSRAVKAPIAHGVLLTRKVGRTMDIARGKGIAHFAPHTVPTTVKPATKRTLDIGPSKHPLITKVNQIRSNTANQVAKPAATKSLKDIKNEAITEALGKTAPKQTKSGFFKRKFKYVNVFSIGILAIIVTGVIVYFSMPSISVAVANMQAGIKATYPEYHPDGYSADGPVSYTDGEVTINFHANTGDTKFSIKQAKSSWDSSAVRNKVNKDSNGEFITTEDRGLTIYTYNGNAAWVNGGILYTINGNAPLSGDQIRRIATSL